MGYHEHELKEYLWENIEDTIATKKNPTEMDMKCLGMAVDILKDLETIDAMHRYGGDEYDYSEASYTSRRRYPDMGDWHSNTARSPRTGRYVSMEGGTMAHLQQMYDNAKNDHERANMQKLMDFAKNNLDNY